MHYPINLSHDLTLVNLHDEIHRLLLAEQLPEERLLAEPTSGYTLSEPDAYARRLAERAEAWLSHARERSRMKDDTLVRKALHSLAFSFRHRCHDFAVPSKLSGTSKHQPALWQITRAPFGTPLDVIEEQDGKRVRLVVSCDGEVLGEVQGKHVSWLRPLIPFGARIFLTLVTGHEESYTLGCNVAFGRVWEAVEALNHALGTDLGGDGYGSGRHGDEPLPVPGGDGAAHHGDGAAEEGAAGYLRLVSSAPFVAKPRVGTPADLDDVVLCRALDGTARAMRRGRPLMHAVRHSPTGIEWGYLGSGPADLARSILLAFTDEATADRLYQVFKAEVVAAVPRAGGVIRAADVRAWLASEGAGTR